MRREHRRALLARGLGAVLLAAVLLGVGITSSAVAPAASTPYPALQVTPIPIPFEPRSIPFAPSIQQAPGNLAGGPGPVTELRLTKVVDNTGGGTATVADWVLTAAGSGSNPTNLSGTSPVDSLDQSPDFQPATYTLGEMFAGSDPARGASYTASAWACVDNQTGEPVAIGPSNTIVVNLGDDITCTITNRYRPPTPPSTCKVCIVGRKLYMAVEGPFTGQYVGLSGWIVTATLTGAAGAQVSTTTDALGRFVFTEEVLAGMAFPGATLQVCAANRPGWRHVTPSCENVTLPNPLPAGYTFVVRDFVNAQDRW